MKSGILKACIALNLVLAASAAFLGGAYIGAQDAAAAAVDPWGPVPVGGSVDSMTISAQQFAAVTPNNGVDLALVTRAIYSHDGGNIACTGRNGVSAIFLFAAGEMKPLRCWRVLVTGTDSTEITAIY
jgi:hypothetical protein